MKQYLGGRVISVIALVVIMAPTTLTVRHHTQLALYLVTIMEQHLDQ
jgi:hypothetical protein